MQPGWKEIVFIPLTLVLKSTNGPMPTLQGGVTAAWNFDTSGLLNMEIDAPVGSSGMVALSSPLQTSVEQSSFIVNGQDVDGTTFAVMGGA